MLVTIPSIANLLRTLKKLQPIYRPLKCLQHHQQRWCKISWTGVICLLETYGVLLWNNFLVQILCSFMVKVQ